jgi:TolA-binding protein
MSRFVWMLMLAGLVTTSACEQNPADRTPGQVTSEGVRGNAGQAVNTAAEFSQQTREEFQKSLDGRLKELDAEVANLRGKGRDLEAQAKADLDRKMADLEKKRDIDSRC